MNMKSIAISGATIILAAVASDVAFADSDLQEAQKSRGATQLLSEEINALIVGNTVKAKSGDKIFLFHYGDDNTLSGKMVGGSWSDTGYYGITDDNRVCLSVTKDKGRLRCLTLMSIEGKIRKYDVDGNMTFELLDIQVGMQL